MSVTRTDYAKLAGTYDRRYADYAYPGIEAVLLRFAHGATDVLEVGCGTGHWLTQLRAAGHAVTGLDASESMLAKARERLPDVTLTHGRAEALPFADASFDRVCCIHAFHHFADAGAFIGEARRVLRPGGGLLIVGLDPNAGHDRWWIYDYYPDALERDRQRYTAHSALREQLLQHGFARAECCEAQRMASTHVAREALAQGKLDKSSTSQLAILTDAEYAAGIARVQRDIDAAAARGEELMFETDLCLHATTAWLA